MIEATKNAFGFFAKNVTSKSDYKDDVLSELKPKYFYNIYTTMNKEYSRPEFKSVLKS